MESSVTKTAIDAYVDQIVKVSHPLAIHLFGSLARGEASVESDIDLLIIYTTKSMAKEAQRMVMRQPSPYPIAADLVFIDLETWKGSEALSPLVSTVKEEGKLVFAAENWLAASGAPP